MGWSCGVFLRRPSADCAMIREDPEDPEHDIISWMRRNEESGIDPNYCLIINGFALFIMFTNPMLLLEASKGYCRSPRVDVPFIFVYFFDMIDCWSVQVSCLHYISRGVSSTLSMTQCLICYIQPYIAGNLTWQSFSQFRFNWMPTKDLFELTSGFLCTYLIKFAPHCKKLTIQ